MTPDYRWWKDADMCGTKPVAFLVFCLSTAFLIASLADVSEEMKSFAQQLQTSIREHRPEWSETQCTELTDMIVSELSAHGHGSLTQSVQSNVVQYLPYTLIKLPASAEEADVRLTTAYLRWAIREWNSRGELTPEDTNRVAANLKEAFSETGKTLKASLDPRFHEEVDKKAQAHLAMSLKSVENPLTPGLKRPIPPEKYRTLIGRVSTFWQQQKRAVEGLAQDSTSDVQTSRQERKLMSRIDQVFGMLQSELENFGVQYDKEIIQISNDSFETKRAMMQNDFACVRNLLAFGVAVRISDPNHPQDVFRRAGLLIADTNFFEKAHVRWHFTRDGIHPACPASPEGETQSYDGVQVSTGLVATSPVAWDKKPYHNGKRHVLFFDGHVDLLPEAKFHSLTNSSSTSK